MHALENHLALGAAHVQHALVAQHARAINVDDGPQKILQLGRVKGFVRAEHKAFHVIVVVMVVPVAVRVVMLVRWVVAVLTVFMVMFMVVIMLVGRVVAMLTMHMVMGIVFQEVRVDVQFGVQVEALEVEHLRQSHLTKMHHFLWGAGVHVFQAVLQSVQLLGRDQIGLADEDLVGKAHLTARFLAVVELLGRVFGVHQGQDGVEQKGLGDLVVHEKSLRHRAGVGQAGGLDDDAVKAEQTLAALGGQQLQSHAQVFADGAANAAVAHLDDLLIGIRDQDVVVDVLFAKLVLDHGNLLAVGLGQHALEQGGFARAQKAGQDGGGDQGHGAVPLQVKKTGVGECSDEFKRRACAPGMALHRS